jgi:ribosomal protein S18 acetylase RimI-like enzyme
MKTRVTNYSPKYFNKLEVFIKKLGSSGKTFRYFKSRDISESLNNHTKTLLLINEKQIIGYGHLDRDPNDLKIWLGICINENFCGQGLGKILMESLLKDQNEDIYLSVDSINTIGINLYKKYGFNITKPSSDITYMKKNA